MNSTPAKLWLTFVILLVVWVNAALGLGGRRKEGNVGVPKIIDTAPIVLDDIFAGEIANSDMLTPLEETEEKESTELYLPESTKYSPKPVEVFMVVGLLITVFASLWYEGKLEFKKGFFVGKNILGILIVVAVLAVLIGMDYLDFKGGNFSMGMVYSMAIALSVLLFWRSTLVSRSELADMALWLGVLMVITAGTMSSETLRNSAAVPLLTVIAFASLVLVGTKLQAGIGMIAYIFSLAMVYSFSPFST